jgi:serine phosphatase RsbU (regulator of sigma subunit)
LVPAPPRDALDLLAEPQVGRLPARLVEEAAELAGCPVALYVADIDGVELRRVAGPERFPSALPLDRAVGPEIPTRQALALGDALPAELRGAVAMPLWLRGRALAVLVFARPPAVDLDGLVATAAAAIELADGYTDAFARARRTRGTSAAAETQQDLLPPRLATVPGAQLAATILPAYEVGGDWFDHASDAEGCWVGLADAVGKGTLAAALSAIALGAHRAARRAGGSLQESVRAIHEAVGELGLRTAYTTAVLGRWEAATRTFSWVRCGHPAPLVWHPRRGLEELRGSDGPLLGVEGLEPDVRVARRVLGAEERLLLLSDGVTERRRVDGRPIGLDGVHRALEAAESASAASMVIALLRAVVDAQPGEPRDDASILVLRPTD